MKTPAPRYMLGHMSTEDNDLHRGERSHFSTVNTTKTGTSAHFTEPIICVGESDNKRKGIREGTSMWRELATPNLAHKT